MLISEATRFIVRCNFEKDMIHLRLINEHTDEIMYIDLDDNGVDELINDLKIVKASMEAKRVIEDNE